MRYVGLVTEILGKGINHDYVDRFISYFESYAEIYAESIECDAVYNKIHSFMKIPDVTANFGSRGKIAWSDIPSTWKRRITSVGRVIVPHRTYSYLSIADAQRYLMELERLGPNNLDVWRSIAFDLGFRSAKDNPPKLKPKLRMPPLAEPLQMAARPVEARWLNVEANQLRAGQVNPRDYGINVDINGMPIAVLNDGDRVVGRELVLDEYDAELDENEED